jgi:hypothetical protein
MSKKCATPVPKTRRSSDHGKIPTGPHERVGYTEARLSFMRQLMVSIARTGWGVLSRLLALPARLRFVKPG